MVGGKKIEIEIVLDEVYKPNKEMLPKYIIGFDDYEEEGGQSIGIMIPVKCKIDTGEIIIDYSKSKLIR